MRGEVQAWLDQIKTFGFHLARLDVRQDARNYRLVMDELFRALGLCEYPEDLDEASRESLLIESMDRRLNFKSHKLSKQTQSAIDLFSLLHRVNEAFGRHALGGHGDERSG